MKTLKAAFLTPIFPPDYCGMANLVYYKDQWLRERGAYTSVITFTPRKASKVPVNLIQQHVVRYKPYFRPPQGSVMLLMKDVISLCALLLGALKDCDIVEVHGFSLFNLCLHMIMPLLKKQRVIHVYKGNDGWLYEGRNAVDFRRWMNRYAYTITNSFSLKEHLEQRNIRVDEVIWSEADPGMFYPEESRNDSPVLVTVKDLYKGCGVGTVLEALSLVNGLYPFTYCVVGDGPCRKDLEKQSCDLRLAKSVKFLGAVEHGHVAEHVRKADIKILTSERESCPHGVIEAMMAGKPVIAHPVDDMPRILKESQAGILTEQLDAYTLSQCIVALLGDSERRKNLGKNAREFALNNFSSEIIFNRYRKVYEL